MVAREVRLLPASPIYKHTNKHLMNIEKLTQAFVAYFKEDEEIVRQIIVDNLSFEDMGFELDMDFQPLDEEYGEDMTDEQLRAEVERIRNTPDWMMDEDAVNQMEGLAREVFDSLSQDERTRVLLDMVLNLCDEIDKLKNRLDNDD